MDTTSSALAMAEKWNVNRHNAGFWDPHMIVIMLPWLRSQQIYDDSSVVETMKQVLSKTLLTELYSHLTGSVPPPELIQRAAEMKTEFMSIEKELGSFLACMITVGRDKQDSDGVSSVDRRTLKDWNIYWQMRKSSDEEYKLLDDLNSKEAQRVLTKYAEFPDNCLELLLRYCQLYYASGEYGLCKRWLSFYLDHVCELTVEGRDRTDLKLKCLWGLVAAMLVSLPDPQSPESLASSSSSDDAEIEHDITDDAYLIPRYLLIIDDCLDSVKYSRKKVLLEKTWILYWSIWGLMRYYFPKTLLAASNNTNGLSHPRTHIPFHIEWTRIMDWIFNDQSLCFMSAVSPQLLRYVAVIAILNRQRQDHFKAAVDSISRVSPKYSDLFTSILESLFIKFDFDEAQEKLALCCTAASSDFLLAPLKDSIEEHARLLIFQTYCRIQKSINIDMIAKKLHMTAETAERWIVNLIRHARLEAKIDSERNRVEIASPSTSVYQQVLDKTRNLVVRTNVLIQSLDRPIGTVLPSTTTQRGDFGNFRRGNNTNTNRLMDSNSKRPGSR